MDLQPYLGDTSPSDFATEKDIRAYFAPDGRRIVERVRDRSDPAGAASYALFADANPDNEEWDPWNGAPILGGKIPCEFV